MREMKPAGQRTLEDAAGRVVDRGLILMPDISGYTAFVHEAHADHAQRIVTALLEALLDANRLGLELCDIEGDALFFFRRGELPSFERIMAQAADWYQAFHRTRNELGRNDACDCGACAKLNALTLKVVGHYGRIRVQRIGHVDKLFGKDVIFAHRLLKNSLPFNSYFLFSDALADRCGIGATTQFGCVRHVEDYPVFGRTALNVIVLPSHAAGAAERNAAQVSEDPHRTAVGHSLPVDGGPSSA